MKKILKKKNIKFYLIFYTIIELISRFSFIRGIINYTYVFFAIAVKSSNFENAIKAFVVLIVMLMLWMLSFVITTLPVTIVLLARKTIDITQEKQNRKYTPKENIMYYRETLKGVSPTTISLMQNLKIEEEKDLTATIMKLQLNKNIEIEGDTIKVVSDDVSKLMPNEKRLFYILADEEMNRKQIEGWKDIALEEAKKQGYIKDKSSVAGNVIKNALLIALFILFILGFKYFGESFSLLVDNLNNTGITDEMEIYEIVENEDFDMFLNATLQGFIVMICIVGMFGWPIFYIVYIVKCKKNSLKRTSKGEQLTEQILGMKRFIHEFSMLSNVDKNSIILWDEFLVYAIVLEENEKIIEEILDLKKVKNFDSRSIIKNK